MARQKTDCLAIFLLAAAVVLVFVLLLSGRMAAREGFPTSFNNYKDPIFPDGGKYIEEYWPRSAGQLGETIFSGHTQYPTAY